VDSRWVVKLSDWGLDVLYCTGHDHDETNCHGQQSFQHLHSVSTDDEHDIYFIHYNNVMTQLQK